MDRRRSADPARGEHRRERGRRRRRSRHQGCGAQYRCRGQSCPAGARAVTESLGEAVFAEQWRQRSRSFDAWALDYDKFRPTYPQAVFDHIAARLVLPDDASVADLGAGTGKAARQMARRGWLVMAIEPGE